MRDLDKKIEETLSSLDDMKLVPTPENMRSNIHERLEKKRLEKGTQIIPMRTILRVAIVFVGIVFLNFLTVFFKDKNENLSKQKQQIEQGNITSQALKLAYFDNESLKF